MPDVFARLADGSGMVIDIRADDQIAPADAEAFAATKIACEHIGWGYERVGAIDPVLAANVRWLAGYRHDRYLRADYADRVVQTARRPVRLGWIAREVGDRMAALPVIFHLLWKGLLIAD